MQHEGGGGIAWAVALEKSGFAQLVRDSTWIYPIDNVLHVLAIALLFGGIAVFDLRILGLTWAGRPADAAKIAVPLARIGAVLAVPTGFILFAAEASAYLQNPVFLVKLAAIAVTFVNLALFHAGSYRAIGAWGGRVPLTARLAAGVSILGWGTALICGRFAAYL